MLQTYTFGINIITNQPVSRKRTLPGIPMLIDTQQMNDLQQLIGDKNFGSKALSIGSTFKLNPTTCHLSLNI